MNTHKTIKACALTVAGLATAAAIPAGCQTAHQEIATGETIENVELAIADTGLTGAQLWAQTCAHCHNSRSPASYSDAQWDIAMSHMRQQAYLTGDQARKILEFLKASN